MSTRCQIGFYQQGNNDLLKPDALLYRHSNGSPGTVSGSEYGVLTDLVPFLTLFHKRRGVDDIEYAAAWTIHHLIEIHESREKELREVSQSSRPEDGKNCVGFGICQDFHGDIEFYYAVRGPKLKVFAVNWPLEDDEPKKEHFRQILVIQLNRQTRCLVRKGR